MVFRSIARNIDKTLFLKHFLTQNLISHDTIVTPDMFKIFTATENQ